MSRRWPRAPAQPPRAPCASPPASPPSPHNQRTERQDGALLYSLRQLVEENERAVRMSVAPEEPGVARLPPHLLLAPNYDTASSSSGPSSRGGQWKNVGWLGNRTLSASEVRAIRSDYPESLFWIAEQYGDRLTGYDLAEAIKVWLKNYNNAEDKSVCEVLKERGWEGIGEAEVFLSHVQAESIFQTLDAMDNIDQRVGPARKGTKHQNSKVWVDYFCLRQLKNDFQTQQVEQLIRETGAVYVSMDGKETGSSYPKRTFCVFELASAVENGATLIIQTPGSGPLAPSQCGCWPCCACCCPLPDYTIDAANATARRADDKAKVDTYIEEGPGFARVNQMMERELRRGAVSASWVSTVVCCCCPCYCMGNLFDLCCSRFNPCGCLLHFGS